MYSNYNSDDSQIAVNTSMLESGDIHSTLYEFNKLFEDQLNSIDSESKDSVETKVQIYEEWVKKLLEEITTLVDCIQEMENETAHGLDILKKNFNQNYMPGERVRSIQNDLKTIIEIVRRARVDGKWSTEGLTLECLTFNQLFADQPKAASGTFLEFDQSSHSNPNLYTVNIEMNADGTITNHSHENKKLQRTTDDFQLFKTAQNMYEIDYDHASIINDVKTNYVEQEILFQQLEKRNADLNEEIELLKVRNKMLEKTNINTKVLVEEVANKHDEILKLKNENIALEEQLKSQEKNMCFKDEIIKELRKDCKKLSSSTPPMSSKIIQSHSNFETSRYLDNSYNTDPRDDVVSEKSYDRKTNITNRLLEIFNFVQSSHQPTEYPFPSDSGILSDYMPPMGNDVISDEDLNNALMSFASRMNCLEKENIKFQAEIEKLREDLLEKTEEVNILIRKPSSAEAHATISDVTDTRRMQHSSPRIVKESVACEVEQVDKQLSDEGSLSLKDNDVDQLANLVATLKQEISFKDKLLSEKDDIIASLGECVISKDRELHDFEKQNESNSGESNWNKELVEKHLSDNNGLLTVKNGDGDVDQISNLVIDLQEEIASKDELLKQKDEIIVSLRHCELSKDRELVELKRRNESIQCNSNRNDETVINLRDALDIHIKTINQQKLVNIHLENKIRDLQLYITNVDRNYVSLQEKYRKLEHENYNVTTQDSPVLDLFVLNEQIYDLFNENIKYEKKISLLQDDNLYLRGEISRWSQDYSYLEEKYLDLLSETRYSCENNSSNGSRIFNSYTKYKEEDDHKAKTIFTQSSCSIIRYIKTMEANLVDELKSYRNSFEQFKIFKDSIEELSSQINILSEESKCSQKFIEESTSMLGSYQHLQQENENLKNKFQLSQKHIQIIEAEITKFKNQNSNLQQELGSQQIQISEQIEQINRIEAEKEFNVVKVNDLTSKNAELMERISEQSHVWQQDIDDRNVSHKEYKKAKDVITQLTNEVVQLKNLINEQNCEILRQSNVLEKQKEDRYTMSKQLESAFQITEKLKFTIDSNLKSISHLQEENNKLNQELNENVATIEELRTNFNTKELEMINKTNSLQQSIDETIKERRSSEKSLLDMSVQNQKLNQQNEDLINEIAQLKDEIKRLKAQLILFESNNTLMSDMQDDLGNIRSQLEKLLVNITCNEAELINLKKQNSALNQQCSERANTQRLLEQKLTNIIEHCKEMKIEYELLQTKYGELLEIRDSAIQSLGVSQNAIDELRQREDVCNQLLAKQDEHIRTLLQDRSVLTTKIDQMHRDMIILDNRLDTVDGASNIYAPFSKTFTRRTKLIKYRSVPTLNQPDETFQSIKKIKRKMYEARNFWQNGMHDAFK